MVVYLQLEAGGQLGVARATESGGWHPWEPRSGRLVLEPLVRLAALVLRGRTA